MQVGSVSAASLGTTMDRGGHEDRSLRGMLEDGAIDADLVVGAVAR